MTERAHNDEAGQQREPARDRPREPARERQREPARERQREPQHSGFLVDGENRVWWELHGSGEREAICLLNGLAMHTKAWHPFLDELEGYDVLLYDYIGQGASSSPDAPVTIDHLADLLARILDTIERERVHVLGVSYGGFVALEMARLHQDRLLTSTLSGILLSHERTFELYQDISLRFYAGGSELFGLYTTYMYEKIFGERFLRATPPEQLEAMRSRFEQRYASRVHSLVRLTQAQDPFFAALDARMPEYRAVRTPTLLLAGEEDRCIAPAAQRKIGDVFPLCNVEMLPESGHVVYLERRDLFFPRLRRFLATRDPFA
jgi:3-oxoadipate enol-lactonase